MSVNFNGLKITILNILSGKKSVFLIFLFLSINCLLGYDVDYDLLILMISGNVSIIYVFMIVIFFMFIIMNSLNNNNSSCV
jgi:hypothetical protein